jgi:hypothetical protein
MEPTQPGCSIGVPIYALQLGDVLREVNILIFHIHHGLIDCMEKLAYLRGGNGAQYFTKSK